MDINHQAWDVDYPYAQFEKITVQCDGNGFHAGQASSIGTEIRYITAQGGTIDLDVLGLEEMSLLVAQKMARLKVGELHFDQLTRITREAARQLADSQARELYFDRLADIDSEAAKELSSFAGRHLALDGLHSITPAVARNLAMYTGRDFPERTGDG